MYIIYDFNYIIPFCYFQSLLAPRSPQHFFLPEKLLLITFGHVYSPAYAVINVLLQSRQWFSVRRYILIYNFYSL